VKKHKLFAEPNLYLRTLAQVSLMELPYFVEYLGRIRALASSAIIKQGLSDYEREQFLDYLEIVAGYNKSIKWILANIELPKELILKLKQTDELFQFYRGVLREYFAKNFKVEAMSGFEFFKYSSTVMDAFIEFHETLLSNYLKMIKRHKIRLIKRLAFLIFGISMLFLFRFPCYFFLLH